MTLQGDLERLRQLHAPESGTAYGYIDQQVCETCTNGSISAPVVHPCETFLLAERALAASARSRLRRASVAARGWGDRIR